MRVLVAGGGRIELCPIEECPSYFRTSLMPSMRGPVTALAAATRPEPQP